MEEIIRRLAQEFSQKEIYVANAVALMDEGNTIPFIARYRKESHGSMDDQLLRDLSDRLNALRNLEKRREEVKAIIEAQGKMTEELSASLDKAETLSEIEDLYRPYKQKRRTRASIAREKGLEPLAVIIFEQEMKSGSIEDIAVEYIDEEKGVNTVEEAINGACDIIAENISDDADSRKKLKEMIFRIGVLWSKQETEEDSVYRLYYDFNEPVKSIAGHRLLAINRGEKEGFLKAGLEIPEGDALGLLYNNFVIPGSITSGLVSRTCEDAWKRLIFPSVEREVRALLTENANEQAIKMFGLNMKPLLMQPPVKGHVVLGLDPGYRTGCKIAVVDATGKVLDTGVAYITHGEKGASDSEKLIGNMIKRHKVTVIAIGNGTASRETEMFTSKLIKKFPGVYYIIVNEAGASVYSASKLAAQEFPDFDVTLRSAVSIARRLQDPLAELVKIDPKSIGVGQYQHDMPPARLSETLDGVVEDCVNAVGVDINTASAPLLAHVAGVGPALSKNIVTYREKNGPFNSRKAVLKVPKLGAKAYEQCAGFMRCRESENVLDNTGVHPESYEAALKLLSLCECTPADAVAGKLSELPKRVSDFGEEILAGDLGIGVPTLRDIVKELMKPGRDIRDELPKPILREDVMSMEDLLPGMKMKGTVRNVIDFGVFVDIGVHQDGLVHISELCDRYVKHPSQVCTAGDIVEVTVLAVEPEKKRISLTMKKGN